MALLALTACADGTGRREAELLPPAAWAGVSEPLYGQNLIADPEVNAKMTEYVLDVGRTASPSIP